MKERLEHIDNLIVKVIAGEANTSELDLLETWRNESPGNQLYVEESKKIFEQIQKLKQTHVVDTPEAWNKLNARISAAETPANTVKIIHVFKRTAFFRVAAAIALVAAMGVIINYVFNSRQPLPVYFTSSQEVLEQKLPDGSGITLNKNSEIVYTINKKNVREVKLSGEAYFEVVHNESMPFEVVIGDVFIKDIGTAFNVKALPQSNLIEVVVESGEVWFYSSSAKGLNLVKGEKAFYDKTTRQFTKVIPDPAENTASYRSRVFVFKGTALRDVIRQVNDVYGSNIVFADERLGNCSLTVMFDNENINELLDMITETLDLELEYSGEKIVLKGKPCSE